MLMNCIQFQSGLPRLKFLALVRCTAYIILLMAGSVNVALSSPLPMPNSEINYPGASANSAFVAMEPYAINLQGTMVTIPLWGASRRHDFSGNAPFVNLLTGKSDPVQIQAWDPVFAASFTPILSGDYNLNDEHITNSGFPGRVDKRILNGSPVTMVRYNAGDGITVGKCRTQLNAFAVPPRTHVRWELEVAFGNADGVNDWILSPTGVSPVLFWQLHGALQSYPPIAAGVDTDESDPTKLMITFSQWIGTTAQPTEIARVTGIARNTMVPIVIEAFLDERTAADGGKGLLQISVNNTLVLEKAGPTLAKETYPPWWALDMYLWDDSLPSQYTRASFFKTAKMIVFPVGTADTIAPSGPLNLTATAPDSTKVNLSWIASTDSVGVTGYRIYRDGAEVGNSATTSFTDTTVAAGASYNYTVKAYDAAGNFSVASNTATVTMPLSIPNSMPNSEINYPGASVNSAFVAMEPYVINIQGTMVTIPLWGASRRHDFSGNAPFVNPVTGMADPAQIQAWDPVFAASFTPFLSGNYNLDAERITNSGFPGRVDKRILNGSVVTMVRYNAGDGITIGKCRSQLNAFTVPPRTHVRWELEVAFGNADGVNDWVLTPTWETPVLFWQLHSMKQSNPPLAANVDTDESDPTKLMITFFQKVGAATRPTEIARVNGISRYTMVPIVIEAFLDERPTANGGKGLLQITVNNTLALKKVGPTLATATTGTEQHWWSMDTYLWNDPLPSQYTRASFFKAAKMIVFPVDTADTSAPSGPLNLIATAPDSTKINLSWSASTDNVGVTGYRIYRDGAEVGYSTTASFIDTTVVAGVTYNYMIKAYDAAGNFSVASNAATVKTPLATADIIRPSAPLNLTAIASASTRVNLSWSASTDNVAVTGYKIYRNGTGVGYSTTASFTDTTVVAGVTYNYEVQAYDAAGNFSVASNTATVKTPLATADIIRPSAPLNLTATAPASTRVNLSWSASTDNVAVTGYKIYRNGTGVGYSASASFTDTTVVAGITYNYEVQAYDAAGNFSVASNTATIKIP